MTIDKISESIARDWYENQGEWKFSMEELRSIGLEVTPNDGDLGQIVRVFIKEVFYRKNGKNGKNKKNNSRGLLSDEA